MLSEKQLLTLDTHGFVEFGSDATRETLEIAKKIGLTYRHPSMPEVQTLSARPKQGKPRSTYSGNFGTNSFPLHSDLAHWAVPPPYFLLRCRTPAKEVATTLATSASLFKRIASLDLARAQFRPRRPLDGKLYTLKLYQSDIWRWDQKFIVPTNKLGHRIFRTTLRTLPDLETSRVRLQEVGDCLLINNWRMVHGRDSIPALYQHREIERSYLEEVYL